MTTWLKIIFEIPSSILAQTLIHTFEPVMDLPITKIDNKHSIIYDKVKRKACFLDKILRKLKIFSTLLGN